MTPKEQRQRLLRLAEQLRDGSETLEDRAYLASRLEAVCEGEDAKKAFGLAYTRGTSRTDEDNRAELNLILSWVAAAKDKTLGHGWTLTKALDEAEKICKERNPMFKPLERSYLEKKWYSSRNKYKDDPSLKLSDVNLSRVISALTRNHDLR